MLDDFLVLVLRGFAKSNPFGKEKTLTEKVENAWIITGALILILLLSFA